MSLLTLKGVVTGSSDLGDPRFATAKLPKLFDEEVRNVILTCRRVCGTILGKTSLSNGDDTSKKRPCEGTLSP